MEYTKVESLEHLTELLKGGKKHYFIQLNFGARSSKDICLCPNGNFEIFNSIDSSFDVLTPKEMDDENCTNIGKAIRCGAFYAY